MYRSKLLRGPHTGLGETEPHRAPRHALASCYHPGRTASQLSEVSGQEGDPGWLMCSSEGLTMTHTAS